MSTMQGQTEDKTRQEIKTLQGNINALIASFCATQNVDDPCECASNVWDGCLQYVGRMLFRTGAPRVGSYLLNNLDMLDTVADYYVYICNIYNKVPSIMSFAYLTNIRYQTFNSWLNADYSDIVIKTMSDNNDIISSDYDTVINQLSGQDKSRLIKYNIVRKITDTREQSLTNLLIDGKSRALIGVIAILNKKYNWDKKETDGATLETRASVADIRAGLGIKAPLLSDNSIVDNDN